MRRILLLVIGLTLVGALALVGTVDAKKKHTGPVFKTGPYPGAAVSKPKGLPQTTDLATPQITKSHGKFFLATSFLISANCGGHAQDTELRFSLRVNKTKGKFSGASLKAFPGGLLKGKAKGKNLTATWTYNSASGTCKSSGTLTGKHL